MEINIKFGNKVREERLKQKLSQEKLANMAEIDRTYLPDIEQGKRNVSLTIAKRIANALQVSLTNLLDGE